MKNKLVFSALLLCTTACSTMSESLQFGSGVGAMTGGIATYAGHKRAGHLASAEELALGASIGLGVGLLASYLTHKNTVEDRSSYQSDQTVMHFGDLPPSPFILPSTKKKGAK